MRDLLGASTQQMGFVLFGVSIGSMVGILSSTRLISHFGVRDVTAVGMICIALSMPILGVGATHGHAAIVAIGLRFFDLGMGASDIAINAAGAAVEQVADWSVLPAMHGCFSVGTVVGGLTGFACSAAQVPVMNHLAVIGVLSAWSAALQVVLAPALATSQPSPRSRVHGSSDRDAQYDSNAAP